jgi:hypothetical protein
MMNREQSDFGHTLPKSYTQLRSAMAENHLLAPRREEEKRAVLPVQTVLTVQVRIYAWPESIEWFIEEQPFLAAV